tara:strand:+ start:306 stop:518 length:213 start_codon:yes stop_codon:yes gene_type:complete
MDKKLIIPEISCQHCVDTIKKALSEIENINLLEVDIDTKTVSIDYSNELDINQIQNLLLDQGYTVEPEQQ